MLKMGLGEEKGRVQKRLFQTYTVIRIIESVGVTGYKNSRSKIAAYNCQSKMDAITVMRSKIQMASRGHLHTGI